MFLRGRRRGRPIAPRRPDLEANELPLSSEARTHGSIHSENSIEVIPVTNSGENDKLPTVSEGRFSSVRRGSKEGAPETSSESGQRHSPEPSEAELKGLRSFSTRVQKSLGIPLESAFVHGPFTFTNQFLTIFSSWASILLPFIPAGFVANYAKLSSSTVFALNFLAIFPLGSIVGLATDEVMLRAGDNVGALVYMTFG